jgi:hypothetical protein
MRASTSASHACGSMSFNLAVWIRVYITAARSRPRSEPANTHDFTAERDAAQFSFGSIVGQANASIDEEAGERWPALGGVALGRELGALPAQPESCNSTPATLPPSLAAGPVMTVLIWKFGRF